jgi:hypothetical protein
MKSAVLAAALLLPTIAVAEPVLPQAVELELLLEVRLALLWALAWAVQPQGQTRGMSRLNIAMSAQPEVSAARPRRSKRRM